MVDSNHKMILSSGRFSGTSRLELTQAFDTFVASDQKNTLVLYFHGGLVSQADGEAAAERLLPIYQTAGGYPFFVIWQSFFTETLRNNWQEIIREEAFSVLVERTIQFLLGKLNQTPGEMGGEVEVPSIFRVQDNITASQGQGEEPFSDRNADTGKLSQGLSDEEMQQFEELLESDARLPGAADTLARPDGPELNPDLKREMDEAREAIDPADRALVSSKVLIVSGLRILARAVGRFTKKRDHGLYTTVVEEVVRELKGDVIGGLLWRHMKKDTADSFGDLADEFGGTALLEEIGRIWEAGHRPRIVLIGHSAGTVYICNLLQKAAAVLPPEICFEVIFLAPACTFKLLDTALQAAGDRIRSFRSFGLADPIERKDAIFPPLYLYSLLYFVSGVLDDEVDVPLVGMERFSSQALNFDQSVSPEITSVLQRLANYQSALVWSGGGATGPGLVSMALKHGDFDNEARTLESVGYLIQHGVI